MSCVYIKRLWEVSIHRKDIKKIELISTKTFSHYFVIVNREGNIKDPSTWGNAWIIDQWYKNGCLYLARDFNTMIRKIKLYCKNQIIKSNKLGLNFADNNYIECDDIQCEIVCEIDTHKNKYPSYSYHPLFTLNYYISVFDYPNNYTQKELDEIRRIINNDLSSNFITTLKPFRIKFFIDEALNSHAQAFANCLDEIKGRGKKLF